MYKAKLVNCLDSQGDLSHVETRNILGEDLILDKHRHEITSRQELHQHVQKCIVLESGVQLDNPRAIRFRKDITF